MFHSLHATPRLALLLGLTLALGLASQPVCAEPVGDYFHGLNAGAPVWNGDILLTPQKAADIAATGTKSLRVNFRLDVQSGETGWSPTMLDYYDQIVTNANNAGLDVLGLWSNETVFANQTQWNDTSGSANNAYVAQFATNAQLLADRYLGRITRWEVWNEPGAWTNPNFTSDPQNAGGTYILPEVYANLLAETYKALEAAPSGNLIDQGTRLTYGGDFAHDIGGSFTTTRAYLEQVYNQTAVWNAFAAATGEDKPWDELGYHFYIRQGAADGLDADVINAYLDDIRAEMLSNGDNSPFRITEFGWQTVAGTSNDEQFQADAMAIAYDALEARDDVEATYWYQWQDDVTGGWGITYDGSTPKLSYAEFAERNALSIPEPACLAMVFALGAGLTLRPVNRSDS